MNCRDFKANLMEYIEEDINISLKSHMEEHMDCCKACRELYNMRAQARKEIETVLDKTEITFERRSIVVMSTIGRNKYDRNVFKRIGWYLLRNKGLYAACTMLLVFVLLLGPVALHRYRSWVGKPNAAGVQMQPEKDDIAIIVEGSLNKIVGTPSCSSNPYDYIQLNLESYNKIIWLGKPAVDYMLEKFATTSDNGLKEYIMAIACMDILHEKSYVLWDSGRAWYNSYMSAQKNSSDNKPNPAGDGISVNTKGVDREKLVQTLKELKQMDPGVGPWLVIYSSSDRVIFYNYRHLIVYDNTAANKGVYRILDFQPLDVGYYQASSVVRFSVSPDGRECIIGNHTDDTDQKLKNLYLYDIEADKVDKIDTELNLSSEVKWSLDSRCFRYNKASEEKIYDTVKEEFSAAVDIKYAVREFPYIVEQGGSSCTVAIDEKNTMEITTGYTGSWGMKDSNTIIGVADMASDNRKLGDFQIVEYDINKKQSKVIFTP